MIKMKKNYRFLFFFLIILVISSIFLMAEANAQQIFSLAHISPEDHPAHKSSLLFK